MFIGDEDFPPSKAQQARMVRISQLAAPSVGSKGGDSRAAWA